MADEKNGIDEVKYQALSGILNLALESNASLEYAFWSMLNLGQLNGSLVPTGGTAGQVLVKDTDTDFDSGWTTPAPIVNLAFKPTVGRYFLNSVNSTTMTSTAATVANYIYMAPVLVPYDCTIDQIDINVNIAVAASTSKVSLYRSNTTLRPDVLIEEVAAVSTATTGIKQFVLSAPVTLSKGELVWAAVRCSHAGVTYSGPQLYSTLTIDHAGPNWFQIIKYTRRITHPYATAMPTNWEYSDAEGVSAICPAFAFRVAS